MTTATLAALILGVVLLQLLVLGLLGFYRRKREYRALKMGEDQPQAIALSAQEPLKAKTTSAASGLAWEGFRQFEVKQRVYEDTAHSICSFYLVPLDGEPLPIFKPGQFLTFRLPLTDAGTGTARTLVRCYSLSDRPRPDHYRVTIKRVPAPAGRADLSPGQGSSCFHEQVQVGSRLQVKAPTGHFYLIEEAPLPVVLIGGGIGITPMLSILNTLLESGSKREVWLFYGVRNGSEVIMNDHLRALARMHAHFHLHLCYSRPPKRRPCRWC